MIARFTPQLLLFHPRTRNLEILLEEVIFRRMLDATFWLVRLRINEETSHLAQHARVERGRATMWAFVQSGVWTEREEVAGEGEVRILPFDAFGTRNGGCGGGTGGWGRLVECGTAVLELARLW